MVASQKNKQNKKSIIVVDNDPCKNKSILLNFPVFMLFFFDLMSF